jgi:hypothetical protein
MTSDERQEAHKLIDRRLRDAETALAEGNRLASADLLAACAELFEELARLEAPDRG